MKYKLTMLIAIALFGCTWDRKSTLEAAEKPLVVLNSEDSGWGADIQLSLVDVSENDAEKIYKAVSSSEKGDLGLLVVVTKKATGGHGFGNAITLKSLGKPSDVLLQKLAALYKQSIPANAKFTKAVQANFVDLGEFAKSIGGTTKRDGQEVKEYKIFFETKNDYGELYLNINTNEKWLEILEKDDSYRPIIIDALTR